MKLSEKSKSKKVDDIVKQDLSIKANFSGVYGIQLLFKEKGEMPSSNDTAEKLKQKLGDVDIVTDSTAMKCFALKEHTVAFNKSQEYPAQLIIAGFNPIKDDIADSIAITQFWNCPNGVELLESCSWQVMISDFMAGHLPELERAEILADWVEIALELFPNCVAVYYMASGKLLTAAALRNNPYEGSLRFFYGGVNARFFNIQGTEDMVVDTLGMYALGLPDMQYHFHTLTPDDIVTHAYNAAIYQFEHGVPMESGDTIDGLSAVERWECQYEDSLIQPLRTVLDVNTGKYTSGKR